ncbi:MAG: hypothetical protein ACI9HK_004001 [Pirellulaceae bacterium]|jgi:hypothetical protein
MTLDGIFSTIFGIRISSTNRIILCGSAARDSSENTLILDAANGKQLAKYVIDETSRAICISPGGRYLATYGGGVVFYDLMTGEKVGRSTLDKSQRCECMKFSPDGTQLLTVLGGSGTRFVSYDVARAKISIDKAYGSSFYRMVNSRQDRKTIGFVGGNSPENLTKRMLWLPGAKRPVIGLRCGISAVIKSNEKNRSFSTKASLNLRTNDLSNVLIYALDTRCSKGIYGDWPAGGHMSFHRSTFVASGTQE